MNSNTVYLSKQFEIIVKTGLETDFILYTTKHREVYLWEKHKKIDWSGLEKISKIYFDGKRRFIWTTLQNVALHVTFIKLENETDVDIMIMYEDVPLPHEGFKYYSNDDLNGGVFDDTLVNFRKIQNNVFEFNIDEEKMLNLNIDIYYIFYGNINKVIWTNEHNNIKKIVINGKN